MGKLRDYPPLVIILCQSNLFILFLHTASSLTLFLFSEAVAQRCSVKKAFIEISQNSQENICARVSFLTKWQASGLQLYFKNGLWHRCFPVNFAKFLRTPFLTEHLRWLVPFSVKLKPTPIKIFSRGCQIFPRGCINDLVTCLACFSGQKHFTSVNFFSQDGFRFNRLQYVQELKTYKSIMQT